MVRLRNGLEWPVLGLGTYRLTPAEIPGVLSAALNHGSYGLVDTAISYKHGHAALADVLRARDASPPKLQWLQSKIPSSEQGYEKSRACALRCIDELQGCSEHLSLLLHWPGAAKLPSNSPLHAELRLGSWLALQDLYREGRVDCIGVSNFDERHLRELEGADGVAVLPFVNQVELHPLLPQTELRAFCAERGIHVQAYSSLGQGGLWSQPALKSAAVNLNLNEAQILLLWAMQKGISVIPRTSQPERVTANAQGLLQLLEDPSADFSPLAALDGLADGTHFCWNPAEIR
ncbi:putative aldose reductase [Pavlovales sp. CCMP2436]|nr:putative aldose reductase [Pavlovales sp. CCMP2436]